MNLQVERVDKEIEIVLHFGRVRRLHKLDRVVNQTTEKTISLLLLLENLDTMSDRK